MLALNRNFLRGSYPPLVTPFAGGRVEANVVSIAAKIETARAVCNLPEIIVLARLAGRRSVQ